MWMKLLVAVVGSASLTAEKPAVDAPTTPGARVAVAIAEQRPGWQCPALNETLSSMQRRVWLAWTRIQQHEVRKDPSWRTWTRPVLLSMTVCPKIQRAGEDGSCRESPPQIRVSSGVPNVDLAAREALGRSGKRAWPEEGGCGLNRVQVTIEIAPAPKDDEALLRILVRRLTSPNSVERGLAAAAAGEMGKEALPIVCTLADLENDSDDWVRTMAHGAVGRILPEQQLGDMCRQR